MTVQPQAPILHLPLEIMALGLQAQSLLQQPVDSVQPSATNGFTEIDMEFGAEAHMNFAVTCEAQAVAIAAEIVRHRRNQAYTQAERLKTIIASRPSGTMVEWRNLLGFPQGFDKLVERDELPGSPGNAVAQRHGLDQPKVEAIGGTIFCHRQQFAVVDASQRNHIDADGQPSSFCRSNSTQNLLKVTATRQRAKSCGVEAIEADIDATHARFDQNRCILRKAAAIGGQRQLVKRARLHMTAELTDQDIDIASRQRLAAGQADFANAMLDETPRNQGDFGIVEQVAAGQECLLFGHTIGATEIAPVGDRYPQIINIASETVLHRQTDLSSLFRAGNGWERLFRYSGVMDSFTALPAMRISPARDAQLWLSAFEASASRGVALFLVGIRDLKQVNDLHGRETGNAVIADTGQRIAAFAPSISGAIMVARLPGREFLLIADATTAQEAEQAARKLLLALGAPLQQRDGDLHISPRIGIALSTPGQSGGAILAAASAALSAAYSRKGRKYRFADSVGSIDALRSSKLDKGLRQALARQEIAIYFQPQFEVASGRLVGAEALARWTHPEFGEIGAEELFAAADRCDLREELSYAIQKQAVGYAMRWPNARPLHLSINLGAEELADDHAARLLAILNEAGFPFERLTVELTEESIVRDFDLALSQLEMLRAKGVSVAIDDFGTGYSSLAYLKSLPLDYLKIDKGMTADIGGNPRDLIVLRAVIALGKALGLRIIAEGVEKTGELELLRAEGCDYFQGYLRSQPLSAQDFHNFAVQQG